MFLNSAKNPNIKLPSKMKIFKVYKWHISLALIGIAMLFTSSMRAQKMDSLSEFIRLKIPISERMDKIDSFLNELEKKDNDSLPYLYQEYAYWAYDSVSKSKAVELEQKGLEVAKSKAVKDSAFIQKSSVFLAFYYEQVNDLDSAIKYYKEALVINDNNRWAINAYEKIGFCYVEKRDYHNSIKYFDLVIDLLHKRKSNQSTLISAYSNLIYACYQISSPASFKKANGHSRRFDSLIEISNASPSHRYGYYLNLADLYNQHNNLDIDKSIGYYNKALQLAQELGDSTLIGQVNYGKGSLYNTTNYDTSIGFLEEAMKYTDPTDSLEQYFVNNGLGTTLARKKNFESSLKHRHDALKILLGDDFKDHESIDYRSLINSSYVDRRLTGISGLAETYLLYFEQNNDPELLDKSIAYFKLADYTTDLLKLNSSAFNSRLFWRELSAGLYGKAIRACFLNNDTEMAFYFMEKNKALLLLEDIADQRFKQSLKLSSSYLNTEYELRKSIYQIEADLKQSELLGNSQKDSLQKLLVDNNLALSTHQDSVAVKLKPFKVAPEIASLKEVQQQLAPNEIVLEYHISIDDGFGIYSNNDKGYVLMLTHEDYKLYEIPNMTDVKNQTLQLLHKIKSPFQTNKDIEEYASLSNSVFNLLFPSEELKNRIKGKHLRIVPDSHLSFLPFEALSTTSDSITYLITQSTIHYQYSNSFLQNMEENEATNNSYLTVVPGQFEIPNLPSLNYSGNEIEKLTSLYSGLSFTGPQASKSNFLAELGNYGIIHLATHANAQDSISPWIAFNDQKLDLEELYLTRNNASLVFLSGCNTTVGKQEVGEGVMSLARGFFYSGAQSVVSTLWSIDDKSTATIVSDFYENLGEGQTKATALHNAKIKYLDTHSLSEASPYYWASFIMLGDDSPLDNTTSLWSYLPYVLLGLAIAFFVARRFRKK